MQLVDFAVYPEKPRDWHFQFLRELLTHVADEKPTDRRYTKWVREKKVFDRRFVAFCERLLGIAREREKPPELNEVGRELREAIEKEKKRLEAAAECESKAAA